MDEPVPLAGLRVETAPVASVSAGLAAHPEPRRIATDTPNGPVRAGERRDDGAVPGRPPRET